MTVVTLLILAVVLAVFSTVIAFVRIRRQARVANWRAEGARAVPVTRHDLPIRPRSTSR
jgi:hypothetical protein